MSILNYLPTAVVSPIVSVSEPLNVPVSKETKQIKVDSSITVSPKTQFGNDDDWRRNFKDCSCSSSSSLKFVHSAASDCEHPPKKLKCSHSNNFYFPTLSSCTVELTKFKQLDDKIGQSSKSDISTSIEKSRRCIHTDCKNYTSTESDDDNVCLRSWMQKKRNRKDSSGKKRQGFKRKTRISISKQDSFTGIKNSENLTNNLNCVTDNSLQVQHNSLVYIPQPSDILHKFPSNVTVCSLCHLPSNFLPQLGDLFGPYRPSYSEVIDRYKEIHKQYSAANMKSCCTSASKTKEVSRLFTFMALSVSVIYMYSATKKHLLHLLIFQVCFRVCTNAVRGFFDDFIFNLGNLKLCLCHQCQTSPISNIFPYFFLSLSSCSYSFFLIIYFDHPIIFSAAVLLFHLQNNRNH